MGSGRRMDQPEADARHRDDAGGVWIITGWVFGFILYVGVVVAWIAGFTPAAPFVIIPAVLAVMIGAGNLIGGRSSRQSPRYNRPDPVPITALRPDGAVPAAGDVADVADVADVDSPTGGTGTEQ